MDVRNTVEVDSIRSGDQLMGWRCWGRKSRIILAFWLRHLGRYWYDSGDIH